MKRVVFAIAILWFALMSPRADADEHRGGDAALGALSGAVVFGPVGAIAGAAVGYAAGPSIAHSWGFRRSDHAARKSKAAKADTQPAEARVTTTGAAVPAAAPKAAAGSGASAPKISAPKT